MQHLWPAIPTQSIRWISWGVYERLVIRYTFLGYWETTSIVS